MLIKRKACSMKSGFWRVTSDVTGSDRTSRAHFFFGYVNRIAIRQKRTRFLVQRQWFHLMTNAGDQSVTSGSSLVPQPCCFYTIASSGRPDSETEEMIDPSLSLRGVAVPSVERTRKKMTGKNSIGDNRSPVYCF